MNQVASLCVIGIWLLRYTREGSEEIMDRTQLWYVKDLFKNSWHTVENVSQMFHTYLNRGEKKGRHPYSSQQQLSSPEANQSSSHPLKRSPYHSVSSLMNLTQSGARTAITQKHLILSIFYLMGAQQAPGAPINSCTEVQQLTIWLLDYGPVQITTLTSTCHPWTKQTLKWIYEYKELRILFYLPFLNENYTYNINVYLENTLILSSDFEG